MSHQKENAWSITNWFLKIPYICGLKDMVLSLSEQCRHRTHIFPQGRKWPQTKMHTTSDTFFGTVFHAQMWFILSSVLTWEVHFFHWLKFFYSQSENSISRANSPHKNGSRHAKLHEKLCQKWCKIFCAFLHAATCAIRKIMDFFSLSEGRCFYMHYFLNRSPKRL